MEASWYGAEPLKLRLADGYLVMKMALEALCMVPCRLPRSGRVAARLIFVRLALHQGVAGKARRREGINTTANCERP